MRQPENGIYDVAPVDSHERTLLLMLPGAKNTPRQLMEHGFIRALRARDLAVDVLALDAHADLYLDRMRVESLLHDTMNEARTHGYRRIWVLGISLGGTGAMLCATQHAGGIAGIMLLAPFLGTRGLIAEVETAGGLRNWQAGEIGSRDLERSLLVQIRNIRFNAEGFPPVYLGYGSEDRYRGASMMLAEQLPQQRVEVLRGGHDWETWIALWNLLLAKQPFSAHAARTGG